MSARASCGWRSFGHGATTGSSNRLFNVRFTATDMPDDHISQAQCPQTQVLKVSMTVPVALVVLLGALTCIMYCWILLLP